DHTAREFGLQLPGSTVCLTWHPCCSLVCACEGVPWGDARRPPSRPAPGRWALFFAVYRGARSVYGPPCIDSSSHSPPCATQVPFDSDTCSEVEGSRYHRQRDVTVACEPSSLVTTFSSSMSVMFRSECSRARAARNWLRRSGTSSWATAAASPQRAFSSKSS